MSRNGTVERSTTWRLSLVWPATSVIEEYHLNPASPARKDILFEFWAHEASLLPLDTHPLWRWRMARAAKAEGLPITAEATPHHFTTRECVTMKTAPIGCRVPRTFMACLNWINSPWH